MIARWQRRKFSTPPCRDGWRAACSGVRPLPALWRRELHSPKAARLHPCRARPGSRPAGGAETSMTGPTRSRR